MIFPVVMYGCEIWTIKKAEHESIDAFNCGVGEDSFDTTMKYVVLNEDDVNHDYRRYA